MCDHSMLAPREYLGIFDSPNHEVYRCKCGALINYRHPDNNEYPDRPMTAREIEDMVYAMVERIHSTALEARESLSIACELMAPLRQAALRR